MNSSSATGGGGDGDVQCWKCGNQYPLQRKFCIKCGSKPTRPGSGVGQPSGPTPTPAPASSPSAPSAPAAVTQHAAAPPQPRPTPTPATSAPTQPKAAVPAPAAAPTPAPGPRPTPAPTATHAAATASPSAPAPQPTPSSSSAGGGGGQEEPCSECGAELSGTVVTDASGRSYHAGCFRCCRCGTALTGNYHVVHEGGRDRFYCREDYIAANSPACATCGRPITGEGAEDHTGAKYHLACFACKRCGNPISGKYVVDSKGDLCCGHCNSTGTGGAATAVGGAQQQQAQGGFRCGTCGGDLEGQVVGVGDVRYHKQCFVCPLCRCDLTSQPFHLENGQLRCKRCLLQERGEVCAACSQVIEEGALQAMTKLWHEACFRCGDCSQVIGAGQSYAAKGQTPICATCASRY